MNISQAQALAEQLQGLSDSPELDIELLLCHVLQRGRTFLFTRPEHQLSDAETAQFTGLLERRMQGEPVAHLTGSRGFWTLDLEVNPSTLIPRPDTETLVEKALELISAGPARVLDLGTGTGAIALSLAQERPAWQVVAVDCVAEAAELAERNRCRLKIQNAEVLLGSWFEPVNGPFEMIVSNPPYIDPQDPHLQQGDVRFEPLSALIADDRGLADIRTIATQARDYLRDNGVLLVEHGYDQTAAVQQVFRALGYQKVDSAQDLGGNDRITWAFWRQTSEAGVESC